MSYAFVVESGPRAGMRLPFQPYAPVVLGRGSGADLVLPLDRLVSRHHARVEVLPDGVYVHDIAGRGTTSVNGLVIRWARLSPGNVIRLGNTLLRLVYEGQERKAIAGADDIAMYEVVDAALYHRGPLPPVSSRRPGSPMGEEKTASVIGADPVLEPHTCTDCRAIGSASPAPELWDAAWLCPSCRQQHRQPHPDLPARIGAFEVLRTLHHGEVHTLEVASIPHGLHAVAKLLPTSDVEPKVMERFLREQRIMTTLHHPNIVRCYAVGDVAGRPFLVFEFLPGGTAMSLDGAAEPVHDMLWLGADIFRALGYAHDLGIVHRDVSPTNVMLCRKGRDAGLRAKLADFGLAKSKIDLQGAAVTLAGEAGGSTLTMSPEQVHNFIQVNPSADLYAAAATLFFLLTGDTPLALPCPLHEAPPHVRREAVANPARRSLGDVRPDLPLGVIKLLDGLLTYDPSLRQRMHAKEIAVALSEMAERLAHEAAPARQGDARGQASNSGELSKERFAAAVETLRHCANLLDDYAQIAAAEVRAASDANDGPRVERAMGWHQRVQQDLESVVARWEELRSLVPPDA